VLADGSEPPEHRPRAVDIVDAPAPVPSSALVLGSLDEAEGPLRGGMLEPVAEGAEQLESASRQVLRGRIEQSAMIGEGNVVEDEPVIVGVERAPAAIVALHAQEPVEA